MCPRAGPTATGVIYRPRSPPCSGCTVLGVPTRDFFISVMSFLTMCKKYSTVYRACGCTYQEKITYFLPPLKIFLVK